MDERSIHVNKDGSIVLTEDERQEVLPKGSDVEAEAEAETFFTPVDPE